MSFNRLLITSVVVENRPVAHVAAQYGVSESWLFELLARYKAEGEAAFEPRPRRPKTVPRTTPTEVVDLILELREKLAATGLDADPTPSSGTSSTTTRPWCPGPRSPAT